MRLRLSCFCENVQGKENKQPLKLRMLLVGQSKHTVGKKLFKKTQHQTNNLESIIVKKTILRTKNVIFIFFLICFILVFISCNNTSLAKHQFFSTSISCSIMSCCSVQFWGPSSPASCVPECRPPTTLSPSLRGGWCCVGGARGLHKSPV